ncbi:Capn15 [Symbiodinium microadriaticum]|nr:Capn15 [Symbiodinium microadriaticum]
MDPSDICQEAFGNCWLLSALASLSNKHSTIENSFVTREFNPRGKYVLRLWDSPNEKYVNVAVDDFIPVDKRTQQPAFTENNGNEMWVMIMEKAFAKYMGSYAATEGGYSLYAMHTITGGTVNSFNFDVKAGLWQKLDMKVHRTSAEKVPDVRFFLSGKHKKLSSDAMYDLVAKYHSEGCVLAAGTSGVDNTIEEGRGKDSGIVPGHAYTILQVYSPRLTMRSGIRLVQLRNPWGSFEWGGDWSDDSDLWKKHPAIRLEMRKFDTGDKAEDDGAFYMSWDDFLRHFNNIDVCFVQRDMSSVRMDVMEEFGICGAFVGCIVGTLKYWFCCFGLYYLWCAKSSTKQAKEMDRV